MRLAANLTMLYTEAPFLERFARAHAAGFHHVEFLFPYDQDVPAIAAAEARLGLTQVLFNLPAGNWAAGERGLASLPDRVDEFRQGVSRAIELAHQLGCRQLNCLAGLRDSQLPLAEQQAVLTDNLRYAARALAAHGLTLLVEALNPYDVPGFLLTRSADVFALQDRLGEPNLKFQYDVYHMQRGEGELASTIGHHLDRIGHIQIADNPGRHQPGTGEINYRFLLDHLQRIGYGGYVSLEYVPLGPTEASLGWIGEYGLQSHL